MNLGKLVNIDVRGYVVSVVSASVMGVLLDSTTFRKAIYPQVGLRLLLATALPEAIAVNTRFKNDMAVSQCSSSMLDFCISVLDEFPRNAAEPLTCSDCCGLI